MYIDSHAHLSGEALFPTAKEICSRAMQKQVEAVVNICTDEASLERGLLLKRESDLPILLTAATTPHDVEKEGESFFPKVEKALQNGDLAAIGETGLDYYYEYCPKDAQKKLLIRYFHLAKSQNVPIVFHCREAFNDLFLLADAEYAGGTALLHCFTGTIEEAKAVLHRGWYISFSGIITFKKSELLREVVQYVPLERMLIETDAPFLAPQSKRGKVNEPSFIGETAEMIALIKNVSLEEVAKKTRENAKTFFSF
jgi:TatD DNase family protein